MKKLLLAFIALFLTFGLVACQQEEPEPPVVEEPNTDPVLEGVEDATITVGEEFDPLAGVSASDEEDGDLTSAVTVQGDVDVNTPGTYEFTYSVKDSKNATATKTAQVVVNDVELVYPTGTFNFKFSNTELRHTFMAAAEKYLLQEMNSGIPVYTGATYTLYSDRMQLFSENYNPIMGFGVAFSTMSADDSSVIMDDEQAGNAGEYTYRTSMTNNPVTFLSWIYEDSVVSDVLGMVSTGMYRYVWNEEKTGYTVVPSMATSNPVPVDPTTIGDKEVSKVWRIELRDDLKWYYNENTDTSMLPAGHETFDANDFYETYKIAFDNQWMRVCAGGGSFCDSGTEIVNAQAYFDGEVEWEEVGIKLIDDNTLEFTYVEDMSEWNIKYMFSSFVTGPIHLDMYEALGGAEGTYGTTPDTIAYNGVYSISYYEADKVLRFDLNEDHYNAGDYFYTGQSWQFVDDVEMRFQEFLAGKLDYASIPSDKVDQYKDYPGIRVAPAATTWRLNFNQAQTNADHQESYAGQYADSDFEPEAIVSYKDFRMAMFHAIDRGRLAYDIIKTIEPQMYLFSQAYIVDAELGVAYRSTPQAQTVAEGLSPSTHGYNLDAAKALWKSAIDQAVADGFYAGGTEAEPVEINFSIAYNVSSTDQLNIAEYIKEQYETNFVDDEHHVVVKVDVNGVEHPNQYFNFILTGESWGLGGISGSTLDAAGFLDIFCDDNRGYFGMNPGKDTSTANIEVIYYDSEGTRHREMWAFNAIVSALNGEAEVLEGTEVIETTE